MLIATLIGFIQYKNLDKASKVIVTLLLFNTVSEIVALWAAYYYQENNPIYNIACVITYFITCIYFNLIIKSFRKNNWGIKLGVLGVIFAIIITIFFQGLYEVNSYFMAFQSIVTLGCCLYYFYEFLLADAFQNRLPVHFWFVSTLLTFWSFTFFYWSIGYALMFVNKNNIPILSLTLYIITYVYYISFAVIFLFYKKLSANE